MYRFHPALGNPGTVVPSVCPPCSKLVDGSCEVCDDADEDDRKHPSCQNCKVGVYTPPPTPWYQNPVITSVGSAVAAAVLTAVVLRSFKVSL